MTCEQFRSGFGKLYGKKYDKAARLEESRKPFSDHERTCPSCSEWVLRRWSAPTPFMRRATRRREEHRPS